MMFVHPSLGIAAETDWLQAQARGPASKATPTKPRGNPERDFQVDQVEWLRGHLPAGSVVFAVKNEHATRSRSPGAIARFYAMREAEGVSAGFPDIGIALPAGRVVWIENKSPRGVLSGAQRDMHAALRAIGHTVFVARDIEGTRAGLIAAGVVLAEPAIPCFTPGRTTVRTVKARCRGKSFALSTDRLPQGFRR